MKPHTSDEICHTASRSPNLHGIRVAGDTGNHARALAGQEEKVNSWDVPDEIHAVVSEQIKEIDTLKKKVEVALAMEQSVRCELNESRQQVARIAKDRDRLAAKISTALDIVNDADGDERIADRIARILI